jgi:hypothetical protein
MQTADCGVDLGEARRREGVAAIAHLATESAG